MWGFKLNRTIFSYYFITLFLKKRQLGLKTELERQAWDGWTCAEELRDRRKSGTPQRVDVVKEDMQGAGMTEEGVKVRVRWRQICCGETKIGYSSKQNETSNKSMKHSLVFIFPEKTFDWSGKLQTLDIHERTNIFVHCSTTRKEPVLYVSPWIRNLPNRGIFISSPDKCEHPLCVEL